MTDNHTELCERLNEDGQFEAADLIEQQAARIQQQALECVSLFDQCSEHLGRIAELEKERDTLKADAERLDWLKEETCDLRCINVPTGGDDCDVRWAVVQHYMQEPCEREIGRSFSDDPRDAIDAALQAEKETRS